MYALFYLLKNCYYWHKWTKKTIEYLLNISNIPMTVDCTQMESYISTLTDSVVNWSDANGIYLPVIPNNSVLNVESQNAVCILQDKSIGLVECVKDLPEIVLCDINNPMEDKEDKDYEDDLSVEMTDSWNID